MASPTTTVAPLSHYQLVLCYVGLAVCWLYVLGITACHYHLYHQVPLVRRRGRLFTTIGSVAVALLCTTTLLHTTLSGLISCHLSYWLVSVMGAVALFAWYARIFLLYCHYHLKRILSERISLRLDNYLARLDLSAAAGTVDQSDTLAATTVATAAAAVAAAVARPTSQSLRELLVPLQLLPPSPTAVTFQPRLPDLVYTADDHPAWGRSRAIRNYPSFANTTVGGTPPALSPISSMEPVGPLRSAAPSLSSPYAPNMAGKRCAAFIPYSTHTSFLYRHRHWFNISMILALLILTLLFMAGGLVTLQAAARLGPWAPQHNVSASEDCSTDISYLLSMVAVFIIVIVLTPLLSFKLRGMADPYQVRLELQVGSLVLFTTFTMLMALWFGNWAAGKATRLISIQMLVLMAALGTHFVAVAVPIGWAYQQRYGRRRVMKQMPPVRPQLAELQQTLRRSTTFATLKAYAVAQYAVEDLLFYQLAQAILTCEQQTSSSGVYACDPYLRAEVIDWMNVTFLAPNAPLRASLTPATRCIMHVAACELQLDVHTLKIATREVELAIYGSLYVPFMEQQQRASLRRQEAMRGVRSFDPAAYERDVHTTKSIVAAPSRTAVSHSFDSLQGWLARQQQRFFAGRATQGEDEIRPADHHRLPYRYPRSPPHPPPSHPPPPLPPPPPTSRHSTAIHDDSTTFTPAHF